jgi:hypothetical protein
MAGAIGVTAPAIFLRCFMEQNELDSSAAIAAGIAKGEWPHTVDAQVWAQKWLEHIAEKPSIATDEGTMLGWFANAIMAGYDQACHQMQSVK